MWFLSRCLIVATVLWGIACTGFAGEWFVNGGCAIQGDGSSLRCANSDNGQGAFVALADVNGVLADGDRLTIYGDFGNATLILHDLQNVSVFGVQYPTIGGVSIYNCYNINIVNVNLLKKVSDFYLDYGYQAKGLLRLRGVRFNNSDKAYNLDFGTVE